MTKLIGTSGDYANAPKRGKMDESIITNEILFMICYCDSIVSSTQPLVMFGISCVEFNHQHFLRIDFKISA
jgi:hypothetical protein